MGVNRKLVVKLSAGRASQLRDAGLAAAFTILILGGLLTFGSRAALTPPQPPIPDRNRMDLGLQLREKTRR